MKYLITILFLLVCFVGFGQATTNYQTPYTPQGSPNVMIDVKGGQKIDTTQIPPVFVDTNAANKTRARLNPFAVIMTSRDNNFWYRNSTATGWILVGSGSSTNCLGTRLISGNATWSGTNYLYDVTLLDYYIGCRHFGTNATQVNLGPSNSTYNRFDIIYADTSNTVGVITGTAAQNPQIPYSQVNPLSRIVIAVYLVTAGSSAPTCNGSSPLTSIYNENSAGEWSIASNATVNNTYATNPCVGSVSTLVSGVTDGNYVSWQNGTTLTLSDYQYAKFYVKPNAAFSSDPQAFLTVSFYLGSSQVSSSFQIGNGSYGMNYSSTSCMLITLPMVELSYLVGQTFDKIVFTINGSPTSFQLDRIYLLSCGYVPPTPANSWLQRGNTGTNPVFDYTGTADSTKHGWGTNGQARLFMPANGLQNSTDTTYGVLKFNRTTLDMYWDYTPVVLDLFPLVAVDSSNNKHYQRIDTSYQNPTSLVNYAYFNAHVGSSGWSLTGNAGTTSSNFHGTTDNVDVLFKRNSIIAGRLGTDVTVFGAGSFLANTIGIENSVFGASSLESNTSGGDNTALGAYVLESNTSGNNNTAGGAGALQDLILGNNNTALGKFAGIGKQGSGTTYIGASDGSGTPGTIDSAIALGYNADISLASKQLRISPYITNIVSAGVTGFTTANRYLTSNGTTATFQQVSLSAGVTGTLPVANGGTNITSYTTGDMLYASGSTTLSKLADVATGNALISGGVGTAPAYGKIGLTTHVSGVLPIANGGTNLSALGTSLQQLRVNAGATALEYFTPSAGSGWAVTGTTTLTGDVTIDQATHNVGFINGNVGIGTNAPEHKLHVLDGLIAAQVTGEQKVIMGNYTGVPNRVGIYETSNDYVLADYDNNSGLFKLAGEKISVDAATGATTFSGTVTASQGFIEPVVNTTIDLSLGIFSATYAGVYNIITGDATNRFQLPDATTVPGQTFKVTLAFGEVTSPLLAVAGSIFNRVGATVITIAAGSHSYTSNGIDYYEF